jgi:putative transposase
MNSPIHAVSVTRTLRLKVKPEAAAWLNAAASEVNAVWNWANEVSAKAARPFAAKPNWLSGFDLNNLSAGATQYFEKIGADTIQRVNGEYAAKRRAARRCQLRWRVSRGARRSLGWVPFKAASLKRKGEGLHFCGKTFRVFEGERLNEVKWREGCFAQDAVGDWWLCLPVEVAVEQTAAPCEAVGIDLGLKAVAVTSDGERCEAGRCYRGIEQRIAQAQRRGHKSQSKRLHRRAANRRRDALHKFSRRIVDRYQNIVVGDVSSPQTSRACSCCGSLTGPQGVNGLRVRRWRCANCGESHDRDVNAARNLLRRAEVSASVRGNESPPLPVPPRRASRSRAGTAAPRAAA